MLGNTGTVTKTKLVVLNDGREATLTRVDAELYPDIYGDVHLFSEPAEVEPVIGQRVTWVPFEAVYFDDKSVPMIGKPGNPFGAKPSETEELP
jgi:hypothetical protein